MKYYYIVAAAGVGKRMNLGYPKQFLRHKDKEIFIMTLETIESSELVTDIIVVTKEEYIEKVKELIKKYSITKVKYVVAGGKERQDSIYNALEKIEEEAIVGVQDGVRPFIKKEYIEKAYYIAKESGVDGAVVGVKVKDTIKVVGKNGSIENTPNRDYLIAAQTPQVFRLSTLKRAYGKAKEELFIGTDDSSLVERYGGVIKIVEGDYSNIKITSPEDLRYLD